MRIVVYTAIFGPISDQLQPLPAWADKYAKLEHEEDIIECLAFIDGAELPAKQETGWMTLGAYWKHQDPRLRARRHKLLPHVLYPHAEYSLWVDGCLTPVACPSTLVRQYLRDHDICVFEHMQRDCLYKEAEACKRLKKDNPKVIDRVVARYRQEGYPEGIGLGETTCVLRRHTPEMAKFNEEWWKELRENSIRDQLSFDYVAWKQGLTYTTFEGTRTENPHFSWIPHR